MNTKPRKKTDYRSILGAKLGLVAKDRIESRRGELPAGKIEEDRSYRTRDDRVYDPDTKRVRPKISR